jgi:dsDNA-specific endonuclease/ATPase MutS2
MPKPPEDRSNEEPVPLPIEDSLDLHTFRPRDIPDVVREYLLEAQRRGFREVRIIHGKGTGYQRGVVSKILENHPAVKSFRLAPAERGHWGATVVEVKEREDG